MAGGLRCLFTLFDDAHRPGVVVIQTLLHDMHGDAQPVYDAYHS